MLTSEMEAAPNPVQVGQARDGRMVYLLHQSPAALPPVSRRDLETAWDDARRSALGRIAGAPRSFRFRKPDGSETTLSLEDRDARCWAGAVERLCGLGTAYGVSLCLRLLALVELLARARWTDALCSLRRGGAVLDPNLLRAAAASPLTEEAAFDEGRLRAGLASFLPPPFPGAFA